MASENDKMAPGAGHPAAVFTNNDHPMWLYNDENRQPDWYELNGQSEIVVKPFPYLFGRKISSAGGRCTLVVLHDKASGKELPLVAKIAARASDNYLEADMLDAANRRCHSSFILTCLGLACCPLPAGMKRSQPWQPKKDDEVDETTAIVLPRAECDLYVLTTRCFEARKGVREMLVWGTMVQMARALVAIHEGMSPDADPSVFNTEPGKWTPIVHRDIKTSNILVNKPNAILPHLLLADFGIATFPRKGRDVPEAKTNSAFDEFMHVPEGELDESYDRIDMEKENRQDAAEFCVTVHDDPDNYPFADPMDAGSGNPDPTTELGHEPTDAGHVPDTDVESDLAATVPITDPQYDHTAPPELGAGLAPPDVNSYEWAELDSKDFPKGDSKLYGVGLRPPEYPNIVPATDVWALGNVGTAMCAFDTRPLNARQIAQLAELPHLRRGFPPAHVARKHWMRVYSPALTRLLARMTEPRAERRAGAVEALWEAKKGLRRLCDEPAATADERVAAFTLLYCCGAEPWTAGWNDGWPAEVAYTLGAPPWPSDAASVGLANELAANWASGEAARVAAELAADMAAKTDAERTASWPSGEAARVAAELAADMAAKMDAELGPK
jgi:serine/threonine protein kinase